MKPPTSNGRWYFSTHFNCDIATEEEKMIEIMCEGGCILTEVNMSYSIMRHLMRDGVIREHDFVEIEFADGTHGTVRKKSIIGFYESEGNTQV